jgi:ribosome biogenesis GTPase
VVAAPGPGLFRVVAGCGELAARPSGKVILAGTSLAVGDWVHVAPRPREREATIHGRHERRTVLARRSAGSQDSQVVAANVDTVFVVTSANHDLNPRRLERYLIAVWDGGAEPVVVVNKVDLCEDPDALVASLGSVVAGAPLHLVAALDGQGTEALARYLSPGQTVGLVGSSGVGKSTLANRLLGREAQATSSVRAADGRGRHTTTSRDLLALPEGGMLMDTPGMRELGLRPVRTSGLPSGRSRAFPQIESLARACRFRDCAHSGEPGCAVLSAQAAGRLSGQRLASWRKLGREQARAARKSDKLARSREQRERRRRARAHRKRTRQRQRER